MAGIQSKTKRDKKTQSKVRLDKAWRDEARQDTTNQDKRRQDKTLELQLIHVSCASPKGGLGSRKRKGEEVLNGAVPRCRGVRSTLLTVC